MYAARVCILNARQVHYSVAFPHRRRIASAFWTFYHLPYDNLYKVNLNQLSLSREYNHVPRDFAYANI